MDIRSIQKPGLLDAIPGRIAVVVLASFALQSCVSSNVKTSETEVPQSQVALTQDQRRSEELRKEAIEDIHKKAAALSFNEDAPDNGYMKPGATSLLTPEEIEQKTRRIKSIAGNLPQDASAQEMEAKQRRINYLKRRGNSHYNSAINSITAEEQPPSSN